MDFRVSYASYPITSGELNEITPEVVLLECGEKNSSEIADFQVKCFDDDTGNLVCSGLLNSKTPYKGLRQWYTKWRVEVYNTEEKLVFRDVMELKNKLVSIVIQSNALGDTLAWFPYIEDFQIRHECMVIVSCKYSELFRENYQSIAFIPHNVPVHNVYAQYILGVAWDSNPVVYPQSINFIPLQQWAADILGIQFIEKRPKMVIPFGDRPIKEKYVCISEYVSGELNNWTEKSGYQKIVNYLIEREYKIVVISLESNTLNGVIDKTGCSLQEAMLYLKYADFFIGGSTGLAWLAWAVKCYVFMINSYTPPFHEFQENCTHIWNKGYPIDKLCLSNEECDIVQEHPVSVEEVIKELQSFIEK